MLGLVNLKKLIFNRGKVQGIFTLLGNIHIPNFIKGSIYQGNIKRYCFPGLNCYSCPGATASCPVGAFQAVIGKNFKLSFYVIGIAMFFATIFGRLICGFMCPFGWFQDLLYKIPTKKFSTKKLKPLKLLKYFIMIFVVWFMTSYFSKGHVTTPYFCKYICPQGILEGAIPLSIADKSIRLALGKLFLFKFVILLIFTISSIFIYRPFCKFICPLGAFYSLFNKISMYEYNVDFNRCINCNKCQKICKMDIDIRKNCKDLECIRCGECFKICPTGAIETSLSRNYKGEVNE